MFKLAFRRFNELNYPEWLVITAFLIAQGLLIWALVTFVQRWVPDVMLLVIVLMMGYAAASLMQFFKGYPRWKTLLRVLWAYLLTNTVQLLLGAAAALVLGIVMGFKQAQV